MSQQTKSLTKIENLKKVNFVVLFFRCMPVHCKYSFFKLPSHTSLKKQHDQSIYWDDVNVVLAGKSTISVKLV